MYNFKTRNLGKYDVIVCGGGFAGVGAALSAARNGASTVIIESFGSLGGIGTEGLVPGIMDAENKGGLIKELKDFLNERGMTMAHNGELFDENGKKNPGRMFDIESAKYFFEKVLTEAGVKILYNSSVCGVDHTNGHINSIIITTYCGNYELSADIYIDATGNGNLSELADLKWECGNPPNPASMQMVVSGLASDYYGTDGAEGKEAYGRMLKSVGIVPTGGRACLRMLPNLDEWTFGFNFEYNVFPDDIEKFSESIIHGRKEGHEVVEGNRQIKGFENMHITRSATYLGVREGRRFFGLYRLTVDDIIEGKKFEDGICPVTQGVDVHKLHNNDTHDCSRGIKVKSYEIPYRCLIPVGSDNILLAGRLISGDFYPFASYRMMGNMATVGEAAGYAAAKCVKNKIAPSKVDGKEVRKYMESLGHQF
ncbi:MAG: FAD-dependent oxidoreductase [Ruminococcaceae bacterium]|nr:FAD-dependent oxidoreductase [Oscillospiraceae bacterium]